MAIVYLDDPEEVARVLVDFAAPGEPRVVCTLDTGNPVQLIDSRHLVLEAHEAERGYRSYAIVDIPTVRYHWFKIPMGEFGNRLLAVAPTLDEIAWNEVENGIPFDKLHVTTATEDRVVATLPDTNPGRCGAPTDSNPAAYTRSGSALFVFNAPLPEISLVVVKDSSLALSLVGTAKEEPSTRPLRVLWSPTSETLYYTQAGSVWQWTQAAGSKVFLNGVAWDWATISSDGTHLAYSASHADGHEYVYLIDLDAGGQSVRIGAGPRSSPAFLDDRRVFLSTTESTGGCGGSVLQPGMIYDLASGAEAATDIDGVLLTWPATTN